MRSSCRLLATPSNRFLKRPELARRGLYVLISPSLSNRNALRLQICRSSQVARSLARRDRNLTSNFVQAAALISASKCLNDSELAYIQRRIASLVRATGMVVIATESAPHPDLPPEQQATADAFARDVLLLLGPIEPMMAMVAAIATILLRRRSLSAPRNRSAPPLIEFHHGCCRALAVPMERGKIRLLAGARLARVVDPDLSPRDRFRRELLIATEALLPAIDEEALVLMRDIDLVSMNAAANLLTGHPTAGRRSWKLPAIQSWSSRR